MFSLDIYSALIITVRLVAGGTVLFSLEQLTLKRQFTKDGVFAVQTVLPFYGASGLLYWVDRWLLALLVLQLIASLSLAFNGPSGTVGNVSLLLCLTTTLLTRWRRLFGGDGAEQLAIIVLVAACLALLPHPSTSRIKMAVVFIAAQVSLSYCTAGIAKAVSPLWRNGEALPAIFSTYMHGHPGVAVFLKEHRQFSFLACWSVITFECLFPLMIVGPDWLCVTALGMGLLFHFLCACWMGLNSFLFIFPSVYPCVIAAVALI